MFEYPMKNPTPEVIRTKYVLTSLVFGMKKYMRSRISYILCAKEGCIYSLVSVYPELTFYSLIFSNIRFVNNTRSIRLIHSQTNTHRLIPNQKYS